MASAKEGSAYGSESSKRKPAGAGAPTVGEDVGATCEEARGTPFTTAGLFGRRFIPMGVPAPMIYASSPLVTFSLDDGPHGLIGGSESWLMTTAS